MCDKMSIGKEKFDNVRIPDVEISHYTDIGFEGLETGWEKKGERGKRNVKEPLKVLKKGDRKIGILKNGSGYYLRDFGRDENYGCHTVEYPSLKLAEREARYFLREDERVVTGRDVGLCSSCDRSGCFLMVNCEDWKTNQVMKAIKRRGGR